MSLLILAASAATFGSGADRRSVPSILDFSLTEREADIVKKIGQSEHISAGGTYRTLEYLLGPEERSDEDYDWCFYFDVPSAQLMSVTRNFAHPANVRDLFSGTQIRAHNLGSVQAISRTMPDGRVLIAIGLATASEPCSQLLLIRRAALAQIYPWIAKDL